MADHIIPSGAVQIDKTSKLGSGSAGTVYKATYNNHIVAVKLLHISQMSPKNHQEFHKEAAQLVRLRHRNIVGHLGVVDGSSDGTGIGIVMQ
ncbi:hypothetical protein HDU76_011712, partial [Blyttiomyces sp. JEL0837]